MCLALDKVYRNLTFPHVPVPRLPGLKIGFDVARELHSHSQAAASFAVVIPMGVSPSIWKKDPRHKLQTAGSWYLFPFGICLTTGTSMNSVKARRVLPKACAIAAL